MTAWFPRCALGVSAVLIAACGGAHTPLGAVPEAGARSESWMLPEAKAQDLVYVSQTGPSKPSTYVLSLPRGDLVGHLNVSGSLCSDNAGNVWIAEGSNRYEKGKLLEYAHGGEKPIRTLRASNLSPWACAVDPTSGNVAAADGGHEIDIYKSGNTRPEVVTNKNLNLIDVTYDNSGTLLILGGAVIKSHQKLEVAELPKGATKIKLLRGFHTGILGHSGFQWEDKNLTLGDALNEGGHEIYRYEAGRRIKSRGVVELANGDFAYLARYWIQGSKAVATAWCGSGTCAPIFLYNYPAGGEPIKELGEGIVPWQGGAVTISVAPK